MRDIDENRRSDDQATWMPVEPIEQDVASGFADDETYQPPYYPQYTRDAQGTYEPYDLGEMHTYSPDDETVFVAPQPPRGPKLNYRRVWGTILGLATIIVTIVLLIIYVILPATRPKGPIAEFIQAVRQNNEEKISQLLQTDEGGTPIKRDDLKPFLNLLKDDVYAERLIQDLQADNPTDLIQTVQQDQTILSLRRYKIHFTLNDGEAILSGSTIPEGVKLQQTEYELGPYLPGDYQFNLRYMGLLGEKATGESYPVRLTYASKQMQGSTYQLDGRRESFMVTLDNTYPAATVFINGEPIDQTIDALIKNGGTLGPIVKGAVLTFKINTLGGTLTSEPITLSAQPTGAVLPQFADAIALDSSAQNDTVRFAGKSVGQVKDFAQVGYLLGPKTIQNQIETGGSKLLATPSKQEIEKGKGSNTWLNVQPAPNQPNTVTSAASTPAATTGTSVAKNDEQPVELTPTKQPTATAPPQVFPYAQADLNRAAQGIMTEAMKEDVLKAFGTYIREDIQAAKQRDLKLYTNLAEPQLSRQRDWIEALKAKDMVIEYEPIDVEIYNNLYGINYQNGELTAQLVEVFNAKYRVLQAGKVVETSTAHDRWVHYLKYDTQAQKWLIYKNEIPEESQLTGPVERFTID